MIFIIISVILIAALIYLTVAASKNQKKIDTYRTINTVLGILGVLTVIGSYFTGYLSINSAKNDPEWASWAGDMFYVFFDLTARVYIILFFAVIISSLLSLTNKKSRGGFFSKIRIITPVAISALLLLITYFYAQVTKNDILPIHVFVYIAGVGEAMAMRLVYTVEYTVQILKNRKTEK